MALIEDRTTELIEKLNSAKNLDDAFAVMYTMLEQKYNKEEIMQI